MRAVLALALKDVRLHGRGILATQLGGMALVGIARVFGPRSGDPEALWGLSFNITFFLVAMGATEWLVSREKTKGTFAWLRTLPVSESTIVMAKFCVATVSAVVLWTAMSLVFGRAVFTTHFAAWLVQQLCLLAGAALFLWARMRFTQKPAQMVPLAIIGVGLGAFMVAERRAPAATARAVAAVWSPAGFAGLCTGLALLTGLLLFETSRWMRRSDTSAFLE